MNIHPIVVHFPIALLIVYTLLEVISLFGKKIHDTLASAKVVCLWIGVVGSFFALSSGEVAQELYDKTALIKTHEGFAEQAHSLYMILAIYYLVKTIYEQNILAKYRGPFLSRFNKQLNWLFTSRRTQGIVVLIALSGTVVLSIVGALGGAIVRGVGKGDPISDIAVKMFVANETVTTKDINKTKERDDD